jgi:phytanoyl-CoA hydroxylase
MAHNHLMIEPQLKDDDSLALRDKVRKITVPNNYDDRIKALCFHPDLISAVTRIIGEEPFMFQDMALVKPPHVGSEKPWHQDNAYFNIPPETIVVGAWVAVDEATAENGCIHILPGSHRRGPRLHFRVRDWQICDTDMDVADEVAVPLKAGGVLLFHGLMNHGTPDNHSDYRRRALQFHFRPASVQAISEEDRLKVFGGQGRGAVC